MNIRTRFPPREDITPVFAACAFPVYSWSILMFLEQRLSAWSFYLSAWDIIGIFAYTQVFALLESATILLVLTLLSAILPTRFFRDKFVAQGSIGVLLTTVWAIAAQFRATSRATGDVFFKISISFFLYLVLYLLSVFGVCYVIYRFNHIEEFLKSFVERLVVILYVYIPISFLSIIVIILRNIPRSN